MRILYLHQYFVTPDMPGATRSYEMAKRLVKMGHEVNMITSDREGTSGKKDTWIETNESGIKVHWLSVPYSNQMSYRDRLAAFYKFALKSASRGAAIGGDVVFASSTPLTIALSGAYIARRKKIPMVFEVRDLWPEIPISIGALKNPATVRAAKRLERFAYKNSERIVALSPGMRDGIVSTGFPEERVTVIPNSCNFNSFHVEKNETLKLRQQYEWLKGRPLVIYTGTIGLINGIDYMVRLAAAARSLDSEVRFLVLGAGREKGKIEGLAEQLGVLNQNFFMMDPVLKSEVPRWLSAADIATSFVIDDKVLWNNSANKFFDALSAYKPVGINHGGWQAEILSEEGAGLVMDVNDIDSAAVKLVTAVNDKGWLRNAGHAAGRIGRECFDIERLAVRLEGVIAQSVIEQSGSVPSSNILETLSPDLTLGDLLHEPILG